MTRATYAWITALALFTAACGDDDSESEPRAGAGGGGAAGSAGAAGAGAGGASGGNGGGAGGKTPDLPILYGPRDGVQATSKKLDLLLMIDNSVSMADKQQIIGRSLLPFVEELVNPPCVDAAGNTFPSIDPSAACPEGSQRARAPVDDLHVGVITSSLGGHQQTICGPGDRADTNDHTHLVPTLARGTGIPSYKNLGFAKFAPGDPDAHSNVSALADNVRQMVQVVSEQGCGFEAPLEAAARFLVDPAPALDIAFDGNISLPSGVDETVLAQRAAFLRPDSAVQVVILSDENDCSVQVPGIGWIVFFNNTTQVQHLPRATAQCEIDANDPCCRSCGTPATAGCPTNDQDASCKLGAHDDLSDPINLRCYDQKRRFGVDLLYPTERYAVAFSDPQICPNSPIGDMDCECRLGKLRNMPQLCQSLAPQANPLFAGGRHPSLVSVAFITGVPWQNLARDPSNAGLGFVKPADLQSRWPAILGNLHARVPPTDPFMQESTVPRSGVNPFSTERITDSDSGQRNEINRHDWNIPKQEDLQYACVFPLHEPRDCSYVPDEVGCDCRPDNIEAGEQNPLCEDPETGEYSELQQFAKAYPSLRELDVARLLGRRAQLGSICAANVTDPQAPDYAHKPSLQLVLDHLGALLE